MWSIVALEWLSGAFPAKPAPCPQVTPIQETGTWEVGCAAGGGGEDGPENTRSPSRPVGC